MDKLNKLHFFLRSLDQNNIAYVSWKNNHQLASVFAGKADLDLFVPSKYMSRFIELCRSQNWIEMINPVATHPWIAHFYLLGEGLEIFHIHVYFKCITGETWIKEYALPFDDWLIDNRVWDEGNKVWILNNASQAYLFLCRHLLKCGSITSRLLYKRELASYEDEWNVCSPGLGKNDICGPIDLNKHFNVASAFEQKFTLPKIWSATSFRMACYPFLRYNIFTLTFHRFNAFKRRSYNKMYLKRKKILPNVGLTIAISGVDGSGKSTMLEEIDSVLGRFMTIKRFHLGRPQGRLIELVWRFFGKKSAKAHMPGTLDMDTPTSKVRAFNAAILSLLRLWKARYVIKEASHGGLMLIDRWPTDQLGKMDGPRIILSDGSGWMIKLCKIIETWSYANMPQADLCFFFTVPVDVATDRNRKRIKENKETDEMILARFLANLDYNPLSKKTVRFDNSGEFSAKRKELLHKVWCQIAKR